MAEARDTHLGLKVYLRTYYLQKLYYICVVFVMKRCLGLVIWLRTFYRSVSEPRTMDLLPFPTQPPTQLRGITESLPFLERQTKQSQLF